MPCLNECQYIEKAIASIKAQTLQDWELLVVDDGSTDGSYELVKAVSAGDSRIHVCRNDQGKGVASALNCGISYARGAYIARWDADDECYPDRLLKMVQYLEAHPGVGMVGCGVEKRLFVDGKLSRVEVFTYEDSDMRLRESMARMVAIGANSMIRKQVFDEVGLYNTEIEGEEELDFMIRVAEKWKLGFIEEPLYIYNVIAGKGRSFRHKFRKKVIMARLNVRAIRKFGLTPINYMYPIMWIVYPLVPLPIKRGIRKIYYRK